MTILFLSRLFYPYIGGVETHVLEVGKRLVGKGHKVIVITERYQSNSSSARVTGEVEGLEIHRIPVGKGQTLFIRHAGLSSISNRGWRFWMRSAYQNDGRRVVKSDWFKKFKIWWWLWKHKDLIEKADIVHCHDVFFWYLPFRFLYPKKKVYTTFHGYETKFPPSKKAIFIRKVSELLSNGSICIGEYIKKWYGASSNYITYGGVNVHNYHATVRGSYAKRIKILFIGRLEEDTGVLIYLKALEISKHKKIGFEFEACGDGSLREEVEQYGKVRGFVKDLNQYIQKADIVFASSYLSILQTLKHKKLVFAVYDNALKEDYLKMAPFAQWIIINNSSHKIADRVLDFMKHQEEKENFSSAGYEWIKKQTWENVTNMYLDLWL